MLDGNYVQHCMESHLNSIPADVRLGEVPPLNRRRLVAFFNCFVEKMNSLLNDISLQSEQLLIEVEKQMKVTDVRLQILEKKLSEIISVSDTTTKSEPIITENVPVVEVLPKQEEPTLPVGNEICEKYFKMLRMGVPEAAVKLKMQSEGVDPSLLSVQEEKKQLTQQLDESSESSVELSDSE